jgi:hypothetical protein
MRTKALLGVGRGWVARSLLATGLAAGALVACSGKSDTDFSDPSGSGAGKSENGGTSGSTGKGGSAGQRETGGSSGQAGRGGTGGRGGSAGSGGSGAEAGTTGASGGVGGDGATGGSAGTLGEGGSGACQPTTCEAEGAVCGSLPDGCDGMIQCGNCPTGCACGDDNRCEGYGGDDMERRHGQSAKSSGFSGTQEQYNELYEIAPCATDDDCGGPCLERGGTEAMCAATYCMESTENYCLPATIWTNLQTLAAEGSDIYADGATLVLWSDPYRDFLLVDNFKLEVPAAATVLGITVTVRRAAGGPNEAVDAGVHIIKRGAMGSADRSSPTPWAENMAFAEVDYGGPSDLWGETWTPADVNAPDFGVALSAAYTQSAGNGRAYVDIVYVTVHYTTVCE